MQSYDDKEYEQLAEKYQKLNWRIISKPGGATVKPDEFYSLYGYFPTCCCRSSEHDKLQRY